MAQSREKVGTIYFEYADGGVASFDLFPGRYVIGIMGGPADIPLESKNLSRRHALLIVGTTLAECSIQDLGSTNKTSFISEDEALFHLEPNRPYDLEQTVELLFGDVAAVFEFTGDRRDVVSLSPKSNVSHDRKKSSPDRWSRTRKSSRSVDFRVPESENGSENHGPDSRMNESKSRPHFSATTTDSTAILPKVGGKLEHMLVYEHAKEALGMDLPYDHELLWIAEVSLKMPIPEGWSAISAVETMAQSGTVLYRNEMLQLEVSERPQTIICRNMYKETKRKTQLEAALGSVLEEDSLPRLLVVDKPTGLDLFHYILPGRNVIGKGFKTGATEVVDIVLNSRACSKRHSCIELRDSQFFLMDLDSTNGTFIGELPNTASRRIEPGQEYEVYDGQLIMFGDVETSLVAPIGASGLFASALGRTEGSIEGQIPPSPARPMNLSQKSNALPGRNEPLEHVQTGNDDELAGLLGDSGGASSFDLDASPLTNQDLRFSPSSHRTDPIAVPRPAPAHEVGDKVHEQGLDAALESGGPGQNGVNGPESSFGSGSDNQKPRDTILSQARYDLEEELLLASELSAAEEQVQAAVGRTEAGGGQGPRVPSKQEGYMSRSEARTRRMLEWARRYYRRQTPCDVLGVWQLPPGALHRILAAVSPVPHLLLLAAACRSLRAATYATKSSVTVNGDECRGLWAQLRLAGTRCGDAHALVAGLGGERLGSVTELDASGVASVTDDTLAAVAESCPLLEVRLRETRARHACDGSLDCS